MLEIAQPAALVLLMDILQSALNIVTSFTPLATPYIYTLHSLQLSTCYILCNLPTLPTSPRSLSGTLANINIRSAEAWGVQRCGPCFPAKGSLCMLVEPAKEEGREREAPSCVMGGGGGGGDGRDMSATHP